MIHVCIKAKPTNVWESSDIQLAPVLNWIAENTRGLTRDMTDFRWGKGDVFFKRSRRTINPMYDTPSMNSAMYLSSDPIYWHFLFHDSRIATLFKLTWA
jgi:hypothetical protein